MPRLDDEMISGIAKTNNHELSHIGAKEMEGARRDVIVGDCRFELRVGDLLDAAGDLRVPFHSGVVIEPLCSAKRGSRWRSRAFVAFHMLPNHSPSGAKVTSVPLMRGEPSRRSVARVLWTFASKNSRARAAS